MSAPLDLRSLAARGANGVQLAIQVTVVADPSEVVDQLVQIGERIESGGRRTSAWFESYLSRGGRSGVAVSPIGQTPTYMGRTCCYQHMHDLQYRLGNLPMPHETTCPGCRRIFRLAWGLSERR